MKKNLLLSLALMFSSGAIANIEFPTSNTEVEVDGVTNSFSGVKDAENHIQAAYPNAIYDTTTQNSDGTYTDKYRDYIITQYSIVASYGSELQGRYGETDGAGATISEATNNLIDYFGRDNPCGYDVGESRYRIYSISYGSMGVDGNYEAQIEYTKPKGVDTDGNGSIDDYICDPETRINDATIKPTREVNKEIAINIASKLPMNDCNDPCNKNKLADSPNVGNPINAATGNKFQTESDYSSKYLKFIRYYNSQGEQWMNSNIGNGWTHSYSDRISNVRELMPLGGNSSGIELYRYDGRYDFGNTGQGSYFSMHTRLTRTSDYKYTYVDGGEIRYYDEDGYLYKIRHNDGKESQVFRNGNNDVSKVVDPYGRELVFNYTNGNISSISLPDGNQVSYLYTSNNLSGVTYQDLYQKTYHYEDPNYSSLLTGITNENNVRYATWVYDTDGRAISSTHADGYDAVTLQYMDDGFAQNTSTEITNSKGAIKTQNYYDQNGIKLTRAFTTDDQTVSSYFRAGNLVPEKIYDGNDNVLFRAENTANNYITYEIYGYGTNDAIRIDYTYAYKSFGGTGKYLPTRVKTPELQKDISYNGDKITSVLLKDLTTHSIPYSTNGSAREWKYQYDTNGLLTFIEGPRVTTADDIAFTYDLMGNIETVSRGDCTVGTNCLVTTYSNYDANGRPGTITDANANGIVTDITYTPRGWVETVTEVRSTDSITTTYEYDGVGNVIKVIMPNNSFLTYEYNDANYLEAIENSLGERIEFTVDTEGMITKQTIADASSSVVSQQEWVYSNTNRLLKMISGAGFETSYTYDPVGNPLTVTNDLSQVTTFTYDALNRIATEVDAKNGTISKTYTKSNKVATVTDQKGNITSYTYNGFGDLIQVVSPDTGTEVYIVDRAGNTTQKTMNDGTVVNYTYDPLNRVTSMTFPSSPSEDVAYGYDNGLNAIGKLTDVVYEHGTITYSYNSQGLLDSSTNVIDGQTYIASYDYNNMGHVTDITYPSGMEVSYSLDTLNRVSGVSVDGVNVVNNISYLPFSNTIDAMSYQNGVSFSAGYNLEYAPTNFVYSVLGIDLANDTYSYELSDRISSITDAVDPTQTQTFAYSNVGELLNATGGYGNISYTYDATGNRTSLTNNGISSSYAVDALSNRLNSVTDPSSTRSFTYDLNGNVEQDVKHDGTVVDLSYNANNRLNSVTVNSTTYEYGYNPFGQRVIESGKINSYGQSGELLSTHDGVTYKEYVYLNGMKVAVIEDGNISYIHNNYLGVPKVITDSSGAVVWEGDYKPFGEMYNVNGTLSNNIRFPGQYQNEESGYSYNYYRDYDPTIGRYLHSDPIGLNGGINTYGYVGGNPVSYTDPDGQEALLILGGVMFFHWGRNMFNKPPKNIHEAEQEWVEMKDDEKIAHVMDDDESDSFNPNAGNRKFIDESGRHEAVYDSCGNFVADPLNMGTYNYFSPKFANGIPHGVADYVPFMIFGNSPQDMFTTARFKATGRHIKKKMQESNIKPLDNMDIDAFDFL